MKDESTFRSVVFPAPVPPLMRQFNRARTQWRRNSSMLVVSALNPTRSSAFSRSAGKRRIEDRAVDSQRWDDGVDTRAIRETRVDHRRAVVDAPADAAHDTVDDAQQVLVVLKCRGDAFELAATFHEYMIERVDHDVADRRVAQ